MGVSVVIPLYNKAEYIRRALDSIAAQTLAPAEIIVVDDGSRDDSAAIVERYERLPVRLIRQSNAGPGAARNRGISEASGALIAFLDADDEWLPEYLETGVRLLKENPQVALISSGMWETPPEVFREKMWLQRGLRSGLWTVTPDMAPMQLAYLLFFLSPCATIARADSIRRYEGFYTRDGCRFGEDLMLWLKVILNEPFYIHLKPLIRVHRSASELSATHRGARPVEPVLTDPDEIRRVCPVPLQPLLRRFCATLACKTACMLGYWGQSKAARELMKRHVTAGDWMLPFFFPALLCCTPIAGRVGPAALSAVRRLTPGSSYAHVSGE